MNYRIFYDADCLIFHREMAHIRTRNPKGNLHPMVLQDDAKYGIDTDEAMVILHMIDDNGKVYAGIPVWLLPKVKARGDCQQGKCAIEENTS